MTNNMISKQINRYENNTNHKSIMSENVNLIRRKYNQPPNDLEITLYSYSLYSY